MVGDTGDRFFLRLTREKPADLIGHEDKLFRRQQRF
jgi:hypothetical protein